MSLDQYIEFIAEDELIEATPQSIRMRKMDLEKSKRHTRIKC
jgi:predicted membrane GTPase involved in stress response